MDVTTDDAGLSVTIRRSADGEATVVSVVGELDLSTSEELDRVVRAELRRAAVLLDLRGVTFMDSSGLRVLDTLIRHSEEGGGTLRIDPALSDSVRQILELTGMMSILPIADRG